MKPELSDRARAWFDAVRDQIGIAEDSASAAILVEAAHAYERLLAARDLIDRDGLLVDGLHGPKENPAVGLELRLRGQVISALAKLRPTQKSGRGPGRPAEGFGITDEQLDGLKHANK